MIDLVTMEALYFDGDFGETVRREAVPAALHGEALAARNQMLEQLAMYSDDLMERLLAEDDIPEELVHQVMRQACLQQEATPVLLGSAYRNKGVQPLLDAVTRYLPSPLDREIALHPQADDAAPVPLVPDPERPPVAMAFKIVDEPFGQLTYMRIYQGTVAQGGTFYNQRTGKKERFSRILRMHADKREDMSEAGPGDIVAVMGVDAASGDTYAPERRFGSLESMFVPDPVIEIAITPQNRGDDQRLSKALARFRKEDPTFRVRHDAETGELLIAGMGELHLDVYVERIRREYNVAVAVGAPKVSYREAPTQEASFDYRHKKQTGGAGQYAHIVGKLMPLAEDVEEDFVFEETVVGGRIPKAYFSSIEKGFQDAMQRGPLADYPVVRVGVLVEDGSHHEVDSSDRAFRTCAQNCFREVFPRTQPVLLEPIMRMEVECPESFQGAVTGDLTSRRGIVLGTDVRDGTAIIEAEVPLAETFGYATELRSMTSGQGTFSMEPAGYRRVPPSIQEEIVAARRRERQQKQLVGAK